MSFVLQTNCLIKKYGQQIAVNKVNLNIKKGAGKTTLMKIVCGLIYQNEGDFKLFESNNLEKGRKK